MRGRLGPTALSLPKGDRHLGGAAQTIVAVGTGKQRIAARSGIAVIGGGGDPAALVDETHALGSVRAGEPLCGAAMMLNCIMFARLN